MSKLFKHLCMAALLLAVLLPGGVAFAQMDLISFISPDGIQHYSSSFISPDGLSGSAASMRVDRDPLAVEDDAWTVDRAYGWLSHGQYRMSFGRMDSLLGKADYSPGSSTSLYSQDEMPRLGNWGFYYPGRENQLRLEWNSGGLGLAIAAVQPAESQANDDYLAGDELFQQPRIDMGAEISGGGFSAAPAVGFNRASLRSGQSELQNDYSSWVVSLPVKYTAGPFTARVGAYYGANLNVDYDVGFAFGYEGPRSLPLWRADGTLADTYVLGGFLALEYRLGMMTLSAGTGRVLTQNEAWMLERNYKLDSYVRSSYFLAVPLRLSDVFMVQPEFSLWDMGSDPVTGQRQKNEWLLGVELRFSF